MYMKGKNSCRPTASFLCLLFLGVGVEVFIQQFHGPGAKLWGPTYLPSTPKKGPNPDLSLDNLFIYIELLQVSIALHALHLHLGSGEFLHLRSADRNHLTSQEEGGIFWRRQATLLGKELRLLLLRCAVNFECLSSKLLLSLYW